MKNNFDEIVKKLINKLDKVDEAAVTSPYNGGDFIGIALPVSKKEIIVKLIEEGDEEGTFRNAEEGTFRNAEEKYLFLVNKKLKLIEDEVAKRVIKGAFRNAEDGYLFLIHENGKWKFELVENKEKAQKVWDKYYFMGKSSSKNSKNSEREKFTSLYFDEHVDYKVFLKDGVYSKKIFNSASSVPEEIFISDVKKFINDMEADSHKSPKVKEILDTIKKTQKTGEGILLTIENDEGGFSVVFIESLNKIDFLKKMIIASKNSLNRNQEVNLVRRELESGNQEERPSESLSMSM